MVLGRDALVESECWRRPLGLNSNRIGKPARVISAFFVDAAGQKPGICSIAIHHPKRGHLAHGASAKCDQARIWGFDRSKIPRGRICACEGSCDPGERIDFADIRAPARQVWFPITVKMVDIRTIGLKFPGHTRAGRQSGEQDLSATRPRRHI